MNKVSFEKKAKELEWKLYQNSCLEKCCISFCIWNLNKPYTLPRELHWIWFFYNKYHNYRWRIKHKCLFFHSWSKWSAPQNQDVLYTFDGETIRGKRIIQVRRCNSCDKIEVRVVKQQ